MNITMEDKIGILHDPTLLKNHVSMQHGTHTQSIHGDIQVDQCYLVWFHQQL